MQVTKGLIIADPWIGYILDGSKTWEMRSTETSVRGPFALIRKGTGAVWGIANLGGVGWRLSPQEMIETMHLHRIPVEMVRSGEVAKWNVPWILSDVQRLASPVPYDHPNGAVTWVNLGENVSRAIAAQLNEPSAAPVCASSAASDQVSKEQDETERPKKPFLGIIEDPNPFGPLENLERHLAKIEAMDIHPENLPSKADLIRDAQEMIERKRAFEQEASADMSATAESGSLLAQTFLTEGNIKNNHFYLRGHVHRFPADLVGGSNKIEVAPRQAIIDWGGPSPAFTDIDGEKQFFRARGWIKRFFELSGARAGDRVLVEETGTYRYRVSLQKA